MTMEEKVDYIFQKLCGARMSLDERIQGEEVTFCTIHGLIVEEGDLELENCCPVLKECRVEVFIKKVRP